MEMVQILFQCGRGVLRVLFRILDRKYRIDDEDGKSPQCIGSENLQPELQTNSQPWSEPHSGDGNNSSVKSFNA